jgi:hypothetical protein
VHTIDLLATPPLWWLEGSGYDDLSVMAGRIAVEFDNQCCRFSIRKGKVNFC